MLAGRPSSLTGEGAQSHSEPLIPLLSPGEGVLCPVSERTHSVSPHASA